MITVLFLSVVVAQFTDDVYGPGTQLPDEPPAAESVAAPVSPGPSEFPSLSAIGAYAAVRGLVNPDGTGANVRPVSLGAGFLHWSERGEFSALLHVAPGVADGGVGAAGALLLQPGGRLGLGLSGRLHRFAGRESRLTFGAYAAAGASLDSVAGVSWTALRGDVGGSLYWWHHHSSTSTAYAALDVGAIIRRRSGGEPGTWLGFATGLSVTLTRVTAGLVLTHCPAGSRPLPGLTGTQVYGTVGLTADALSL